MTLIGEGGGILQQLEAVTTNGIARAAFGLEKPGLLEVRASSEPALLSELLQLDVSQSGAVAISVLVPEMTTPTVDAAASAVSMSPPPRLSQQLADRRQERGWRA
jgi:beta-N-acetylhexosaminidase